MLLVNKDFLSNDTDWRRGEHDDSGAKKADSSSTSFVASVTPDGSPPMMPAIASGPDWSAMTLSTAVAVPTS